MIDDQIKKMLEQKEALILHAESLNRAAHLANPATEAFARHVESLNLGRHLAGPTTEAQRFLEANSGMRRLVEETNRQQELMRAAAAPIQELRRTGLFGLESPLQSELDRARQLVVDYEARFRLPEMDEAARLMDECRASPVAGILRCYMEEASNIRTAMEAMCSPWLDRAGALRSIGSFAELQGIGYALNAMPVFGAPFTEALRTDLGDWRDRISWPEPIFTDLVARTEFYVQRGFDPALTDFPAAAFREGLEIAGLRREPPTLVDRYGAPVPDTDDPEEEESFARTNSAHDWLQRLETQLRRFIDENMNAAFGSNWARHRLPNGLYEKWHERKRAAEEGSDSEWPLIAYADFTEYEPVICKRDNWREVFAPIFGRPESVRESLQRLYPIRVCTMHARPITQDDELLLYVEARRLIRVIF